MSSFAPDSPVVATVVPSPNFGERRGGMRPNMLLLHYTGMPDEQEALHRLCSPESEVSAHYLVLSSGEIIQCVPEARRAWHAGEAFWAGVRDINSCSIGIEVANPGHEWGYSDFADEQIEAVIALCRDILSRHDIPAERVLAHSDVAPTRKQDPGEKFPWERLHRAHVGRWVEPAPIRQGPVLQPGDRGPAVGRLQMRLGAYGYGIAVTGIYDALTEHVVAAFQRHFRPARVDGVADVSTLATLRALIGSP
jgi:N-acetylmuramoyl-L-alanine amidase